MKAIEITMNENLDTLSKGYQESSATFWQEIADISVKVGLESIEFYHNGKRTEIVFTSSRYNSACASLFRSDRTVFFGTLSNMTSSYDHTPYPCSNTDRVVVDSWIAKDLGKALELELCNAVDKIKHLKETLGSLRIETDNG